MFWKFQLHSRSCIDLSICSVKLDITPFFVEVEKDILPHPPQKSLSKLSDKIFLLSLVNISLFFAKLILRCSFKSLTYSGRDDSLGCHTSSLSVVSSPCQGWSKSSTIVLFYSYNANKFISFSKPLIRNSFFDLNLVLMVHDSLA